MHNSDTSTSVFLAALVDTIVWHVVSEMVSSASELHQMCVWSIGVKLQHLSVTIGPVFYCHFSAALSYSSIQLLLTQSNECAVQSQPILLADVVVVLHASAFGLSSQRGLRDNQQTPGKVQHWHHLPRIRLAQPQVQQRGHWTERGHNFFLSSVEGFTGKQGFTIKNKEKSKKFTDPSWVGCHLWLLWRSRCRSPSLFQSESTDKSRNVKYSKNYVLSPRCCIMCNTYKVKIRKGLTHTSVNQYIHYFVFLN